MTQTGETKRQNFNVTPEQVAFINVYLYPGHNNQLEALVRETVELVEIHIPQVETSSARQKLGWRQQPWKLSESDNYNSQHE